MKPMSAPKLPPFSSRPTAWRQVRTPSWIATSARRMVLFALVMAVVFAFVPWQQTATGAGNVIAYVPAARQQPVESPIDGRVARWLVREGQQVEAGDALVELADNDPDYLIRLEDQRRLVAMQLTAAQAKQAAADAKLAAAQGAREAAEAAAAAKIDAAAQERTAAEQVREAANAELATAASQAARAKALAADGLRSTQSLEDYTLKANTAEAKRAQAEAKVRVAEAKRQEAISDRDAKLTEADGKIAAAQGDLEVARADEAEYGSKLVELDIKLARQRTQVVRAPVAGTVARVYGGEGGEQVSKKDDLLLLVPNTNSRAVELHLDGNDVSLLRPGQEVRLQFEGWPALQFSGWPSVAVGTFGGVVDFIDAIDDGKGQFRVVILPLGDDVPWPEPQWLRLGLRAKGWIMLASVPMGYELWRQLNDFPPAVPVPAYDKGVGAPVEKSKAGKAWRPK